MGKASKWFRSVFGLKKSESPSSQAPSPSTLQPGLASKPFKDKRQWSFVKSYRESGTTKSSDVHNTAFRVEAVPSSGHIDGVYPDKHVMTVAAAKAAVAEAAASAAQAAAAADFRLTSSGWCPESFGTREEWAAIKIQAAFRGCLARRALRALKGLVKLQALVRGHIDRKRTAEWLHRVHAIVRVQACVRAGRVPILQTPFSNSKSSKADYNGPATPDKLESPIRSKSMKFDHSSLFKRNASKSHLQIHGGNQDKCWDDDKSNRILEIDSGKQHFTPPKRRNLFPSINYPSVCDNHSQSFSSKKDSKSHQSGHSMSSYDEGVVDSPQLFSVSSRDNGLKNSSSPFAPSRSDDSRSYLSSYSDYPSYMAYTESSKAKVRTMSAPKQRPHQYERSSSSNRYSVQGLTTQRENTLHANFTSKAYPGSGRLDKFGMPVGYRF